MVENVEPRNKHWTARLNVVIQLPADALYWSVMLGDRDVVGKSRAGEASRVHDSRCPLVEFPGSLRMWLSGYCVHDAP